MSISNRKVIKNASWIIICKIVQSLLAFVIGMFSARYLGPSNYGLITYASSIVAFAVPLAELGLRNVLVEEIISHSDHEGKILGTSLAMSLMTSLVCIAGCIVFVSIVNANEKDTLIVCALYSISLIFQSMEIIQYWYQAKLLSKYTSIASLFAYLIVSIYKIFLLVTQKSVYWFAVSYTLDYLIISIILIFLYQQLSKQKLSFSFSLSRKLFSRSKYYIISNMMVTMFSQTDKVMIKMMLGNAENGYYSTAITIAGISSFIFSALIDSLRPVIFVNRKVSQKKFEKSMSVLYSIIIYLGLAQSIFITLSADLIIPIIYGEAYIEAIPILKIITWYSSFSYMGSVRNIWILAEEKQRYLWIINLSGAILNVLGNFILIPIMGSLGAAIASVFTQFFTNFLLCFIIKPIRDIVKIIWVSLNPKFLIQILIQKETKYV